MRCDGAPTNRRKRYEGASGGATKLSQGDELEQLKEKLLVTQKELLQKSAALGEHSLERYQELDMIVHGLRNPASSILSAAEYLIEEAANALTEEQIILLQGSAECSLTILRMIDNVSDISKLERGLLMMSRTRTDLVKLVDDVVRLNRPQAERKTVCVKVHSEHAALPVEVDADKISRAINNLVSSALKLSLPGGQIEIQIRADETFASVAIKAEGQTTGVEDRKQFFEPAESSDVMRPDMADSSLGLAVAKRIVALHDGTIDVQSRDGEGSLFTINLPKKVNARQAVAGDF